MRDIPNNQHMPRRSESGGRGAAGCLRVDGGALIFRIIIRVRVEIMGLNNIEFVGKLSSDDPSHYLHPHPYYVITSRTSTADWGCSCGCASVAVSLRFHTAPPHIHRVVRPRRGMWMPAFCRSSTISRTSGGQRPGMAGGIFHDQNQCGD
jgi:hypothetical protein